MTAHVVSGAAVAQGAPWLNHQRQTFVELLVDLSKRNLSAAGFASGDTIKLMAIPAGSVIQNVCTQVVTPEGAAATASLGDSGSATRFHSALTINSTAGTYAVSADIDQLYSTADYLLLTLGGTMNGAGVAVLSITFDLRDVSNRQAFSLL